MFHVVSSPSLTRIGGRVVVCTLPVAFDSGKLMMGKLNPWGPFQSFTGMFGKRRNILKSVLSQNSLLPHSLRDSSPSPSAFPLRRDPEQASGLRLAVKGCVRRPVRPATFEVGLGRGVKLSRIQWPFLSITIRHRAVLLTKRRDRTTGFGTGQVNMNRSTIRTEAGMDFRQGANQGAMVGLCISLIGRALQGVDWPSGLR